MDIAEVARRTGIAASALRYYERRGLIASVGPAGTRRRFAPGVLDQLALIALGLLNVTWFEYFTAPKVRKLKPLKPLPWEARRAGTTSRSPWRPLCRFPSSSHPPPPLTP